MFFTWISGRFPAIHYIRYMCHLIRDADRRQLTFKLNDISDVSEQAAEGSLQATFHLRSPAPLEPISTILQFGAEGGNLCGADFELVGSGYRISLIKKRFYSGTLFCVTLLT